MEQTGTMTVAQQKLMLAVRQEMGWPAFKPANDCIGFVTGEVMSFATGLELARVAELAGKDLIHTGWKNARTKQPESFTIAWREQLTVDIVERVVPYAANDDAPIIFVSTRADEHFAVDRRGSLARVPGKPTNIAKGKTLAMKRIRATAATMGDTLLENNRFLPTGAAAIEPEAPTDVFVRFG